MSDPKESPAPRDSDDIYRDWLRVTHGIIDRDARIFRRNNTIDFGDMRFEFRQSLVNAANEYSTLLLNYKPSDEEEQQRACVALSKIVFYRQFMIYFWQSGPELGG